MSRSRLARKERKRENAKKKERERFLREKLKREKPFLRPVEKEWTSLRRIVRWIEGPPKGVSFRKLENIIDKAGYKLVQIVDLEDGSTLNRYVKEMKNRTRFHLDLSFKPMKPGKPMRKVRYGLSLHRDFEFPRRYHRWGKHYTMALDPAVFEEWGRFRHLFKEKGYTFKKRKLPVTDELLTLMEAADEGFYTANVGERRLFRKDEITGKRFYYEKKDRNTLEVEQPDGIYIFKRLGEKEIGLVGVIPYRFPIPKEIQEELAKRRKVKNKGKE